MLNMHSCAELQAPLLGRKRRRERKMKIMSGTPLKIHSRAVISGCVLSSSRPHRASNYPIVQPWPWVLVWSTGLYKDKCSSHFLFILSSSDTLLHEEPLFFQHLCLHFLLHRIKLLTFLFPLYHLLSLSQSLICVKLAHILHSSFHLSAFLAAPPSSPSGYGQPGSCELSVTFPLCSFCVLQWSTSKIYSSLGPTGRSFVLI